MVEIWKPIVGCDGAYEVSNHGRVRSTPRITTQKHYSGSRSHYSRKGQILKPSTRGGRYQTITIRVNGKPMSFSLHRLVAEHFLEKEDGKDYINHLDANPKNNHVDNLEWCTQSHNIQYAYDNGTKIPPHQKRVIQMDLDGIYINEYISEAEAARQTGTHQPNIYKVCRGKRQQAGGYKWKYAE